MRKTVAKFKFDTGAHIDGQTGGTLSIKETPVTTLCTFRPKHARREYTLTLPEVCEMVAWRVAKKEVV